MMWAQSLFEPNTCRLCAGTSEVCMPIFSKEENSRLDHKIKRCLPISISEDDGKPKQVCYSCVSKLEISYNFVEGVISTDFKFDSVIQSSYSNSIPSEKVILLQSDCKDSISHTLDVGPLIDLPSSTGGIWQTVKNEDSSTHIEHQHLQLNSEGEGTTSAPATVTVEHVQVHTEQLSSDRVLVLSKVEARGDNRSGDGLGVEEGTSQEGTCPDILLMVELKYKDVIGGGSSKVPTITYATSSDHTGALSQDKDHDAKTSPKELEPQESVNKCDRGAEDHKQQKDTKVSGQDLKEEKCESSADDCLDEKTPPKYIGIRHFLEEMSNDEEDYEADPEIDYDMDSIHEPECEIICDQEYDSSSSNSSRKIKQEVKSSNPIRWRQREVLEINGPVDTDTREEKKIKRMRGESYTVNKNGETVLRNRRSLMPTCNSPFCRGKGINARNCHLFTDVERQAIHTNFWKHMTWEEKRNYVLSHIEHMYKVQCRSKFNKDNRRNFTWKYFLPHQGIKRQVCKVMFCNTLCVGEKMIRMYVKKSSKLFQAMEDAQEAKKHASTVDQYNQNVNVASTSQFKGFLNPSTSVSVQYERSEPETLSYLFQQTMETPDEVAIGHDRRKTKNKNRESVNNETKLNRKSYYTPERASTSSSPMPSSEQLVKIIEKHNPSFEIFKVPDRQQHTGLERNLDMNPVSIEFLSKNCPDINIQPRKRSSERLNVATSVKCEPCVKTEPPDTEQE